MTSSDPMLRIRGTADLGFPPRENLGEWQQTEFSPERAFPAEVDGRPVGSGELHWSTEDGDDAAWLSVAVLPGERGRGVGSALVDRLTEKAVGLGMPVLQTWTARRAAALWGDTLVLTKHRAHRLGMPLKLDGLEHLAVIAPDCPAAHTWDAEENRPMLAVNDAVGFTAVAVEGQWRKELS